MKELISFPVYPCRAYKSASHIDRYLCTDFQLPSEPDHSLYFGHSKKGLNTLESEAVLQLTLKSIFTSDPAAAFLLSGCCHSRCKLKPHATRHSVSPRAICFAFQPLLSAAVTNCCHWVPSKGPLVADLSVSWKQSSVSLYAMQFSSRRFVHLESAAQLLFLAKHLKPECLTRCFFHISHSSIGLRPYRHAISAWVRGEAGKSYGMLDVQLGIPCQ